MARAMGFYTDTSVCIGCKACQVACHEWNQLPAEEDGKRQLSGQSYDNTVSLSAVNWRHVQFIEQFSQDRAQERWLMSSDTCKHCVQAGCLEVCPTGAIIRTEFDTVYIQEDVCNGCRDCVAACPFGVIAMDEKTHVAKKCTLCYDRLQANLAPACAQACPTASIQFGPLDELRMRADQRLSVLLSQGQTGANIYGKEDMLGGLNSFYLLLDKPAVYGLPDAPKLPSRNVAGGSLVSAVGAAVVGLASLLTFRKRRIDETRAETRAETPAETRAEAGGR